MKASYASLSKRTRLKTSRRRKGTIIVGNPVETHCTGYSSIIASDVTPNTDTRSSGG
ncbi:hypothetical protein P8R50_12170 [Methanobacterium formicicum]|nr:hypothetical protein [Methanobacterium formicicum]MDG3548610.1 hypothetical protein [Methanobacterium formicicum]